ncbi:hypothetical protein QUC31_017109 [Theobroma cacao]
MAKLGCRISVCVFIFFHLLQVFSYGVGDVLEAPPFNINQQSLLQYLSLGDIKIDLPALYVFGDSYVDNGNNNFLPHSAVANYLPFGIDFDGKPTGRATNGRTVVDFIATVGGFQYPPPILGLSEANRKSTRTGVNYASGSSGILSENGRSMHMNVLNFFQQVDLFENATLKDLKSSFSGTESFTDYLSKSVFFIHIASNDLGFTYETTASKDSPDKYSEVLVEELFKQLQFVLEDLYKIFQDVYASAASYVPPFNINQQSLLQYLSLKDIKIDSPALYVFGDSYVDDGNNNFLPHSAVANYLPFGIDFDGKPTGRATNGRTVADFIATVSGFQFPPPILGMSEADRKTTRTGVNYASGSSGILSENGRSMHMNVLNFFQQVDLFENTTLKDLKSSFSSTESFTEYLSKSVFFIHTASNDLGLTYETATSKSSPDKYAEVLVEELFKQLQRLYKLGARKFLVNNVSPLGCQPFNINTKNHTTSCVEEVNERISIYNKLLSNSLTKWQSTLSGSKFVLGDLYKIFQDVYASPVSYGFKDVNTSCCVDGNGARILPCAQNVAPCEDRKSRVFFDPFHPTESMHFLWARRLLKDSSVCSPINLIQLMQA